MTLERTIVACIVLALLASAVVRVGWRSWRARFRARHAVRGERRAEGLLESLGYAIEARQQEGAITLAVDGTRYKAPLRCDLLVRRGGERFVAEVKTGARAPRLDHPPTRRQLVEYLIAFGVDGALLVDPDAGRVREIRLASPLPAMATSSPSLGWLVAAIAIAIAILALAR